MIQHIKSFSISGVICMVASASAIAAPVDLGQFTPSSKIIGYSIYTVDSIYLPVSVSGLATKGFVGSGGGVFFDNGTQVRTPYLSVGRNLVLGTNVQSLNKVNIGGSLSHKDKITFNDTVQVGQNYSSGSATDVRIGHPLFVKGNLSFGGPRTQIDSLVQVGGTFQSGSATFSSTQPVKLAGATGYTGTTLAAGQLQYNAPLPSPLPLGTPLKLPSDSLPGFVQATSGTVRKGNINITAGKAAGTFPGAVTFITGIAGTSTQTDEYWHCSTSGFDPASCSGDTLLPGDYGVLNIQANQRAILIKEGFYSFDSVFLGSQNAIVAAQPTGGRTVIQTIRGIGSAGGNSFIGPVGGLMANKFGSDSGKFLGGTMMVVSGRDLSVSSDQRVWATLSAPKGDLQFGSQVLLFGQAFGNRLVPIGATNNVDFGQGEFIPIHGLVPTLSAPPFQVGERADTSCHDVSQRPCRDTLVTVSMPYVTAYPVTAKYAIVETVPRGATSGTDFSPDTGTIAIPINKTTTTIRVRIFDDSSYEGPERFQIVLSSPFAALFPNASGDPDTSIHSYSISGTIVDDDQAPLVRLTRDSARGVLEGNTGTAAETFTVRLVDPVTGQDLAQVNAPQLPVVFRWGALDGTATVADNDYVPVAGRIDTIPAGSLTKTIGVRIVGDSKYEYDEWYRVAIDSLYDASATSIQGFHSVLSDTGWIVNDDAPPVWVENDTVREPSTGSVTLGFRVHLTGPSKVATSFSWRTLAGTATSGLDYIGVDSAFVVLPPGDTDTVLSVTVLADSVAGEGSESLRVALWNLSGLVPGLDTATGTILADSARLHVSVDSVGRVVEADSFVTFHVHSNWYPADTVRAWYRTVSRGATSPERYSDTSGIATLLPGRRIQDVQVRIHRDTVWEPDQEFVLVLDSIASRIAFTRDTIGLAVLLDDGPVPEATYASNDTAIREDSAGAVAVRVKLSRPAGVPLSVGVPVRSATTAATVSYALTGLQNGVLTFPARVRNTSFGVAVVSDTIDAPDRLLSLGLQPIAPALVGADSIWSLTILDDDHRPLVRIHRPVDSLRTKTILQTVCWSIDGVDQPCKDTTLPEGWNTIVRTAKSPYGLVGSDTVRVWVDTTPPRVQVFKITGPNPHDRGSDTTWWGKRAKTMFGKDTVWYWVRDSIMNPDRTWRVKVDTLFALTDFIGDGVHPKEVGACDTLLNCAVDTGWIELRLTLPTVVDGIYLDRDGDGRVDALVANLSGPWNAEFLPTFDLPLKAESRAGQTPDSLAPFFKGPSRGFRKIVGTDTVWVSQGVRILDSLGKPAFGVDGFPRSYPLGDTVYTQNGNILRDSIGQVLYRVSGPGGLDYTRLVVPVKPPFAYGVTSWTPDESGVEWESYTHRGVPFPDTFPIRDGVAPVILGAVIHRVENYTAPDTLVVIPSEPLVLAKGQAWLQVGHCPTKDTCTASSVVWATVPASELAANPDGSYSFLVKTGDTGSVRPKYLLRFLGGVSDTLGNTTDTTNLHWNAVVEGAPRPPFVQVTPPSKIPFIPSSERDRPGKGGILFQATNGNSRNLQYWEPGYGYLPDNAPSVQEICPDRNYCNGPDLFINHPMRMIIYIYDNSGTYAMSRVVDITQADIDQMNPDKIDRLRISLQWNHRTSQERLVGSGIYLWRILSYVQVPGKSMPIIDNRIYRVGVKVQGE